MNFQSAYFGLKQWAVRAWRRNVPRVIHAITQGWLVFDQFLNWLLNPFSYETWSDETISSRCGRLGYRFPYKFYEAVINWVFKYIFRQGPNHCVNAYHKELTRYNFPPSMRGNITDKQ